MGTSLRCLLVVWIIAVGLFGSPGRPMPTWANAASVEIQYVSPRPNAQMVQPATTLAIRVNAVLAVDSVSESVFSVVGSLSGEHSGTVILADDHQTVIFRPGVPFAFGETVNVVVSDGLRTPSGLPIAGTAYLFSTMLRAAQIPGSEASSWSIDEDSPKPVTVEPVERPAASRTLTLPADFPVMTATVTNTLPAGDFYFLAPLTFSASGFTHYNVILDGNGEVVYFSPVDTGTDFKRQPDGTLSFFSATDNVFHILDDSYSEIRIVQAGNGYVTDLHELLILPNGNALLMIYDSQPVDMSVVVPGGQPDAIVIGLVLQELDADGNVLFEWRSWDHIAITDSYIDLTTPGVDYIHGNAIEVDTDGNLMISSRNTSEVTKIDRATGDIIWRLGGKNNEFTSSNESEPYFGFQHDIRRLANGNVTLFDNRVDLMPEYSRAVEFELDEANLTIDRVWEHRNTPDLYAFAMGNAQRMESGNTVINWGTAAQITEVMPDGTKVFELVFAAPYMNYRAFRSSWVGRPSTPPVLVVQDTGGDRVLAYSWNGATEIASFAVYGGPAPRPTALIDSPIKLGFETRTLIGPVSEGCYFYRVMPIDKSGAPTRYSNEVTNCPYSHTLTFIARP